MDFIGCWKFFWNLREERISFVKCLVYVFRVMGFFFGFCIFYVFFCFNMEFFVVGLFVIIRG